MNTRETIQPAIEPAGQEKPESVGGDQRTDDKAEAAEQRAPAIGTVLENINTVDQKIAEQTAALESSRTQIDEARQGLDVSATAELTPAQQADTDRLTRLQEERDALEAQKESWISEHGRENLPEGVVMPSGENGGEMKAGSLKEQAEKEETEEEGGGEEKEKDLGARKREMKELQKDVVKAFERGLKSSWRTKDAANLDLSVDLMKSRAQQAIDKKSADYVSGKTDKPPFEGIWLSWESTSLLDRILGKPNFIKKVDISFDNDKVALINQSDVAGMEEQLEKEAQQKSPKPEEPKADADKQRFNRLASSEERYKDENKAGE